MNKKTLSRRKCSALLAAGAGAAVCLTGGTGQAAFLSGTIAGSNGTTVFSVGDNFKAVGGLAKWFFKNDAGRIQFSWSTGGGALNGTGGGYIAMHGVGVTISNAMPNGFADYQRVPSNVSQEFIAVKYTNIGNNFGWLHVVSSNATGGQIVINKWGYENAGATCKTLSDSVTTRKLSLSDGHVKLLWSNANEDGVARYEVQSQDASGAWQPVSSDTPGAGQYAANVPGDSVCRIVVEKVDGTTEEIPF